ncbi:hypothetical protein [Bacillus cereus]|nr:hypothetical protein [Bacillus cereus]
MASNWFEKELEKSTKVVVKGLRLVSVTYVSAGRCRERKLENSI